MSIETATFGAGCFWGVEANFMAIQGVTETSVGYMGGPKKSPTYKEVCTDTTGHAEVVQVKFDPEVVSYTSLLDAFFLLHDPTTRNRQGPDVGSQYRSVIFYHNGQQHQDAIKKIEDQNQSIRFQGNIVTVVTAAEAYWPAEAYHQKYLQRLGKTSCGITK